MEKQHIQARLITLLRQEKVQLWLEPYTAPGGCPDREKMKELADRLTAVVGFPVEVVAESLERIRSDSTCKDKGNKEFKETSVATLELHLPPEGETKKRKVPIKTKLDITTEELKQQISQEFGFEHFNLILSGKTLSLDGSEDPGTTPFLEIADQKGNPLHILKRERKALILAMGFHEKGRALMKKRNYSAALSHLLHADQEFKKCNSSLLSTVDNFAVLQLDVVWCFQALEQMECLSDAKERLQQAQECFTHCYGQQQSRLQQIKVENLYGQLSLDPEKMNLLMSLGFSEQDARLGLRACRGDVSEATIHVTQRQKEKTELMEHEREKRRQCLQNINTLVLLNATETQSSERQLKLVQLMSLGYQQEVADSALSLMGNDVQKAAEMLQDNGGMIPATLLAPSSSSSQEPSTSDSHGVNKKLVKELLEDIPRHEEDYLDLTLQEERELMDKIRDSLRRMRNDNQ
ncbi:hypothetical protein DNTS_009036 [Danionella cerebrum]|uniref:UBA domain-containing protein n=1 Tax=Danionella cerebrum TaxID=2873325 RepID=A0A553MQ82_9TELE|nr:hypothetical protein DNTS_009036 [Danionella translucida]TRY55330.1 hypothetical protein DNTS_009036 [Danionella translucida]